MTFKQRAISLLALALGLLSIACSAAPTSGPPSVADQGNGCPAGYRQLDIEADVVGVDGDPVYGRAFTLTIAAGSLDPEYGGVIVEGVGVTGANPYAVPEVTDPEYDPVLCIPPDKAVAVMTRVSVQDPPYAYETVECGLIDRGIVGAGPLSREGDTSRQVARDSHLVELTDLAVRGQWVVAQCDWLQVPDGHTGDIPPLFPRY